MTTTPELKRFNAACDLDRSLGKSPKTELARRWRVSVRALHRALTEPGFSGRLRRKAISYTERVFEREAAARRAA